MSSSTLTLNIPKRRHVELVGKSGSTVKKLQADFSVKIDIPNRDDPRNEITISGKPEDLDRIHNEIDSILGIKTSTEPLGSLRLDIPPENHGALIGRGGTNLRDLEKKFRVSIKVPRRDDSEKYVVVEGAEADLQGALDDIEVLLKTKVTVVSSPSPSIKSNKPATPPKEVTKDKPAPKDKPAASNEKTSSSSVSASSAASSSTSSSSAAKPAWDKKNIVDYSPFNKVLFFPDKGEKHHNLEQFLSYLGSATTTLDICVFTITDDRISNVILQAHKRGVKVRVITDNDTSVAEGSDIQKFREHGISVKMDTSPYHMHHKFAAIDKRLLLNGSFNWTRGASTNNCENVMVTNNKDFLIEFENQFESMWNDTTNFK